MKLWVVQYREEAPDHVYVFEREEDAERFADLRRKLAGGDVDVWPLIPRDSASAAELYNEEKEGWE